MSNQLTEAQVKKILQGIHVPPQPQILVDLQMEQIMPAPDIQRIANLIAKDVGLSGTMLKFVNSPFYGLANKITSIEQAVSLLGIHTVINILNGLAIKGEMSDEAIIELTSFWDTANDIAMVCAAVAKKVGYRTPDEAYALGLFHNAGIPLMLSRFDDYITVMEKTYSGQHERVIDLENEKFNTNHCVVGYFTAKSWNLPEHICQVIAEHHNTKQVFAVKDGKNQQQKTLLAVLKLAEHICGNYKVLGLQDSDPEWEDSQDDILEYLGLTAYDIEDLKVGFIEMGVTVY
ncbi:MULTISPECIES: HDOD domain-containing protein [unclassified Oleiphilus]|nr:MULTISPECIES: HDOD domain-containing protein [unclassified Oleiphilus]KZY42738.1 histidine kinase [Oleiphilus sp. HI0050]KZY76245.1 histidine kinase [Oleiphilus sp. HI0069]KZY76741.1 histidine kinase [Oleiphilus sp. HI0068]KZY87762.1 histidine kinase [Oleiphilus sp. HI0072]KZZ12351.1 histidine kinase [Oleiphilus sp. HI0078]KZZ20579.1 histidine kinase [Oleiphilus sp. HI0081]KZZ38961.1 histidine kinase [Oleiphilus sp. HI0085]